MRYDSYDSRKAFRARVLHFDEIYEAFTSTKLKRLRRTNKRRRASYHDRIINWFLGRPGIKPPEQPEIADASPVKLVLIGDGSRLNGIKGTLSSSRGRCCTAAWSSAAAPRAS